MPPVEAPSGSDNALPPKHKQPRRTLNSTFRLGYKPRLPIPRALQWAQCGANRRKAECREGPFAPARQVIPHQRAAALKVGTTHARGPRTPSKGKP